MLVLIAKHLLFLNFVYVYKRHICAPKCIAEAKDANIFISHSICFKSIAVWECTREPPKEGTEKKDRN